MHPRRRDAQRKIFAPRTDEAGINCPMPRVKAIPSNCKKEISKDSS